MAHQYRYSQNSFRNSVVTSIGLTLIVSFLVWLFARLLGVAHPNWITGISACVFFSFCSAMMIWRYLRQEVVFAIRPDGLFYARHSSQAVPWDNIKQLRLGRAENDFLIEVSLWPARQGETSKRNTFMVDLSPLDASVERVIEALSAYKPITALDDS